MAEQKYCKIHNDKHIIDKDYSLCCHPKCIGSVIAASQGNVRIYQHLKSLKQLEDFYAFIVQELLREYKLKGKPPILNKVWLFYRLQSYYTHVLKKEIICQSMLPSGKRDDRIYIELNEEIIDELDSMYAEQKNSGTRPDRNVVGDEMMALIKNKYDDITLQYFLGEINLNEYAKLKQKEYNKPMTLTNAKVLAEQERKELQVLFREHFSLNLTAKS